MMKKTKLAMIFASVVTIILEILPFGAVCNFAGDGETFRRTFSYFSLIPFGYANFAPLFTAILTCLLLVLSLIACFRETRILNKLIFSVAIVATVFSLMPLLYGLSNFSLVGALISAVLCLAVWISAVQRK